MPLNGFDLLEFVYYLIGFWAFIFNRQFRAATMRRWRNRRGFSHLSTAFEIGVATFCGLIPLFVMYWIVTGA